MIKSKWPFFKLDPVRLFDLHISDLVCHDPYFVRMYLDSTWKNVGDDFFIALLSVPEVVAYFCEVSPDHAKWIKDGMTKIQPQEPIQIQKAEEKPACLFVAKRLHE